MEVVERDARKLRTAAASPSGGLPTKPGGGGGAESSFSRSEGSVSADEDEDMDEEEAVAEGGEPRSKRRRPLSATTKWCGTLLLLACLLVGETDTDGDGDEDEDEAPLSLLPLRALPPSCGRSFPVISSESPTGTCHHSGCSVSTGGRRLSIVGGGWSNASESVDESTVGPASNSAESSAEAAVVRARVLLLVVFR